MPSIHETAYPRLKGNLSGRELDEVFTATPQEIEFSKEAAKGDQGKTHFLILLKSFQRLGYFPFLQNLPPILVRHLSRQTKIDLENDSLIEYDQSPTRRRHIAVIRKYCGVISFGPSAKAALARAVVEAARTKEDLADIINVGIEELVRLRFELPAFSSLLRAARAARSTVNRSFYHRVADDTHAV